MYKKSFYLTAVLSASMFAACSSGPTVIDSTRYKHEGEANNSHNSNSHETADWLRPGRISFPRDSFPNDSRFPDSPRRDLPFRGCSSCAKYSFRPRVYIWSNQSPSDPNYKRRTLTRSKQRLNKKIFYT